MASLCAGACHVRMDVDAAHDVRSQKMVHAHGSRLMAHSSRFMAQRAPGPGGRAGPLGHEPSAMSFEPLTIIINNRLIH